MVSVEEVLLVAGEYDNKLNASRMKKAVVYLKIENLVYQLTESGVFSRDLFVQFLC